MIQPHILLRLGELVRSFVRVAGLVALFALPFLAGAALGLADEVSIYPETQP